jgi:hypothetical protein
MGISLLLPLLAPLDPLLLTPSQVLFRSTFRLLELLLTLKLLLALQLLLALKLLLAVLLPPAIQFLLLSTFSLVELSQPLLYTDHFFNPLKMHLLSLSSLVFFTLTLVFFKFTLNCIPIHGGILNFEVGVINFRTRPMAVKMKFELYRYLCKNTLVSIEIYD